MMNVPLKASDIEFAFLRDGDEEGTEVAMSLKDDPEYDDGMTHLIVDFWPADLVLDEATENTFVFDLSEDLVKERLIRAGFEYSQAFQEILDEKIEP